MIPLLMATVLSQINSSLRRTFSGLGWSEGSNETDTFTTRIHRRVESVVGPSRMKYVLFASLITTVFLYILATEGIESSYQNEYHISSFHRNPYPSSTHNSVPVSPSDNNSSSSKPTASPTVFSNETMLDGGGTTINHTNESDPSYTMFLSIILTMIGWMMMVQIISCIRRGGFSTSSSLIQRRQSLQDEQRRAIMDNVRLMQVLGRRQMSPEMLQRLRLGLVQRDFTGDDYEMLMQLDEMQGRGDGSAGGLSSNRRGAPLSVIERLPTHKLSQSDIDNMQENRPPAENIAPSGSSGNTRNRRIEAVAPQCHVCLAPYEAGEEVRTLLCLHQFHKPCIDQWLQTNAVCPICKFSVSNMEENG